MIKAMQRAFIHWQIVWLRYFPMPLTLRGIAAWIGTWTGFAVFLRFQGLSIWGIALYILIGMALVLYLVWFHSLPWDEWDAESMEEHKAATRAALQAQLERLGQS